MIGSRWQMETTPNMDGRKTFGEDRFGFRGTKPVVARTLQLDGWTHIFLGGPVRGTKPVVAKTLQLDGWTHIFLGGPVWV